MEDDKGTGFFGDFCLEDAFLAVVVSVTALAMRCSFLVFFGSSGEGEGVDDNGDEKLLRLFSRFGFAYAVFGVMVFFFFDCRRYSGCSFESDNVSLSDD